MFGFANALLLALLAAAGVDLVLALRRKAVGQLFTVPHYLFGDWGGEARVRWGQRAFLLALMLYEFTVVFCNSMARENWPFLQAQLSPVLDTVMYTLLCGKILLGTRYTWRELLCAGALYFVARWVYFNGQNIWFLGLVMVLLAAKDVPLRRSMQAFLACGVPTLAAVEVLHFAGIIAPDALSERSGSYRLMFGYGHPNTFGGIAFGLVLAWVLLRAARLTWAEIAAVAGAGLFLYKGPASRSPALCAFLLAALLAGGKLAGARKGHKATAGLCAAMVPVVAAVSFILPLFVIKIGPWADEIGPAWLAKFCRTAIVALLLKAGQPADLPHLAGMGGIPYVRHKNCRPDADGLAGDRQYFCVFPVSVRPGAGRAGRRADGRNVVPPGPLRPMAGAGLLAGGAVLRVYGDTGYPYHQ